MVENNPTAVIDDSIALGRRVLRAEAEALLASVDMLDEGFARACRLIVESARGVLLTGMGKSGLVARKWASTFSSTGTPAYFLNPAEASHGDLGILRDAGVLICLSASGETEELDIVLRHAREISASVIVTTRYPKSRLGRAADVVLPVILSREACPLNLAPTTSTTLMMAIGDALAMSVMQLKGFGAEDFAKLHPGGSLGRRLTLRVDTLMHQGENLPIVSPTDALDAVLVEMTRKRLGVAVVMSEEAIIGIITDGDLRRFLQKGGLRPAIARELMTENPKTLRLGSLASEARELLERNQIQHLVIVDGDGKLSGVIHFQDLLRARVL